MKNRSVRVFVLVGIAMIAAACNTRPTPEADTPDPTYSISDFVWFDLHYNGIQDADETGIAEVLVNLYTVDADGVATFSDSTRTDSLGFYEFEGLSPGRYLLEFDPPEDYIFTFKDQGDSDEEDSDADPTSGRTEAFQLGESEEKWDAGMVLEESAIVVPTSTHTQMPTATPVPPTQPPTVEATPTATPGEATFVHLDDDTDDTQDCVSQELVNDVEVDLTRTLVQREDGHLWITIQMGSPLVNDYSFAVAIFLISGDQVIAFLWEIHEGALRVGMMDPQTGDLILEAEEGGMEIHLNRENGTVEFHINAELVPSPLEQVLVNSFHTPREGDRKNCDQAGIFSIPEGLQ